MSFYAKHIFPRVLDWALGNKLVQEHRRQSLAPLSGRVLEIGFGTGLNLPFYPQGVTELTAIDRETMLPRRVEARIAAARMPVEQVQLDAGGTLPFEDETFDGVVTTYTLCSINDVVSALSEIRRVVKANGTYVFLEHGRSDDPKVAKRQDFWNPLQRVVGCGCNINRKIDALIVDCGFEILELNRFLMPDVPQLFGETYRGIARAKLSHQSPS